MNYPEGMQFDQSIFSRQSDAEQVFDAHCANIKRVIVKAFKEWPLKDDTHCIARWADIRRDGIDKAYTALSGVVRISEKMGAGLIRELNNARDANNEGDMEWFMQSIEAYMNEFSYSIEMQD